MSGKSPIWKLLDSDREFFARELDSFVPDRLFDAHIHLGPLEGYNPLHVGLIANTPEVADMKTYRSQVSWLAPGRELAGALVIPNTLDGEKRDEGNRFAADQLKEDPESGVSIIIHPDMDPGALQEEIERFHPSALKCYHLMVKRERTLDAGLEEYLPEPLVRVADEAELPVLVHLVRDRALADADNQTAIRKYCQRYKRMKLVLVHGARGLNPSHTIQGIDGIKEFDNLYFDTSSVMEGGTLEALIRNFGTERLMWASDYPFSHLHGRCVAIGDGFIWLYDHMDVGMDQAHPDLPFALAGLECLRTLKYASWNCGLTDDQIEAVFCKNALALYGR